MYPLLLFHSVLLALLTTYDSSLVLCHFTSSLSLNKMPSLDPTPTVATPHWLSIASTTTSTLAPVSVWGKPNAIACHSPEDTTDYLSKVLAPSPTHSSSTAPPYGQISRYDHQNHNSNTSKPTWLSAALVTTGSPLLSAQGTH